MNKVFFLQADTLDALADLINKLSQNTDILVSDNANFDPINKKFYVLFLREEIEEVVTN